eukprot:CAMPEP_0202906278 /NCGR_PEP_ID=MMETSP1392-20130828/38079_1 /ASSEMBLY_ACC=CAM_ASM_000868 /TAXON_ID=225041 /ORGANISM="Chlamydomonas chlamydogama, Strain SAG 11-48b" /LENGTH=213 /DNA_ID=CAMNT_0049594703 /DNA_START=25 /DNA_END=666 /DNA_ORIENTATION=+
MVVGTQCPAIGGLTWVKGGPVPIPNPNSILVLEFWATWCPPCRQTIPHLTDIQRKYSDKNVQIIGITSEDNAQKVKEFVASMGSKMEYTVAMDTSQEAQRLMNAAGAHGIPHAFIVDRSGTIRFSGHPADPSFSSALRDQAEATGPASGSGAAAEKVALPLITESYEELMANHSAKELKAMLTERGIDTRDCLEKGDFARKVADTCSKVTYYK